MARRPCHSTAALAGSQACLEGWTRETGSHVLQVGHGRSRHRLNGLAATHCPRPAPGAEIMGRVRGRWPAWPGGGTGLGL